MWSVRRCGGIYSETKKENAEVGAVGTTTQKPRGCSCSVDLVLFLVYVIVIVCELSHAGTQTTSQAGSEWLDPRESRESQETHWGKMSRGLGFFTVGTIGIGEKEVNDRIVIFIGWNPRTFFCLFLFCSVCFLIWNLLIDL